MFLPDKLHRLAITAALGMMLGVTGLAQEETSDAPIKVTSVIHGDGTRTDTQTNPSEKTGESKTYDAAQKLIQRAVYTLDENGQPKEGKVFNAKGVEIYRFSYTRDTTGKISEEKDFNAEGKVVRQLVYRYSSKGELVGIDGFDANGNRLPSSGGTPTAKKKKTSQQSR